MGQSWTPMVGQIAMPIHINGDNTAMSVLLLSVMGAVAEFERAIIRERQAVGIRKAKQKGVYKGRKASFTYDQAEEIRQKVAAGIP
jgi:DNA invertase Pin-like site-specific DNA recombinase